MDKKLTYQDSGVSIDKGNQLISSIQDMTSGTHSDAVLSGVGGFAALFDIQKLGYRYPILVSGTDGVGTKLKLAVDYHRHETIGIDLVAMCVNDILVQGAQPLFFLDYFACSSLDPQQAKTVIQGIVNGCQIAQCVLMGGETAEMPGLYQPKDYDLAGFCVGAVEKDHLITGQNIQEGDHVIGLASSGPHANGFSLIRRVLSDYQVTPDQLFLGSDHHKSLLDLLMAPTKIYVPIIQSILKSHSIHGMAHITGGGLLENIPRILPAGLGVSLQRRHWPQKDVFQWIQNTGHIDDLEMFRVFNQGIGYVLVVSPQHSQKILEDIERQGEEAYLIGQVESLRDNTERVVVTDL